MKYGLFVLFCSIGFSQTTQVTVTFTYPNAVIADMLTWNRIQLSDPVTGAITLTAPVGVSDTSASVASTAGYATSGTLLIDAEELAYTGATATSFTGITRAQQGTTAAAHLTGTQVHLMSYGTNAALVKALLMPGVVAAYNSLGASSTVVGPSLSAIQAAQTAISNAAKTAVQ